MNDIMNKFSNFKKKFNFNLNFNLNYDIVLPIVFLVFIIGILFFITYKPIKISLADQLQTVHTERSRDPDDKTHFASGQERWDVKRRRIELKKEKQRRRFMDKGVYD